jgi:hypothetical protein
MEHNDFKHACFISYRNGKRVGDLPKDDLLNTFATQIFEALESELQAYFDFDKKVFLDFKCLQPGQFLIPVFSEAICHSVAFIVVYTPNYLSENKMFCASELKGMIEIESKRLGLADELNREGLIITIVLRGRDYLPEYFKNRVWLDFTPFNLSTVEIIRHPVFSFEINKIAELIYQTYQRTKITQRRKDIALFSACNSFKLANIDDPAEGEDVRSFIKGLKEGRVSKLFPQM